jgi:hypothetical protein
MHLVVDLSTDSEGRPVGTLHVVDRASEPFTDWLELLHLIDRCVDEEREENT